jgi:hypothetical protein
LSSQVGSAGKRTLHPRLHLQPLAPALASSCENPNASTILVLFALNLHLLYCTSTEYRTDGGTVRPASTSGADSLLALGVWLGITPGLSPSF